IVTLLFCVSCGQPTDSKAPTEKSSVQSTDNKHDNRIENALIFINSYVENCNKMKEAMEITEWVNSNELVSQGFKTEFKRLLDEAYRLDLEIGIGADPIFDAQDYPDEGFELESLDEKTNYIVVKGKNWPDFKLTLKMINENNNWLVDGCGIVNIPNEKRMAR